MKAIKALSDKMETMEADMASLKKDKSESSAAGGGNRRPDGQPADLPPKHKKWTSSSTAPPNSMLSQQMRGHFRQRPHYAEERFRRLQTPRRRRQNCGTTTEDSDATWALRNTELLLGRPIRPCSNSRVLTDGTVEEYSNRQPSRCGSTKRSQAHFHGVRLRPCCSLPQPRHARAVMSLARRA